jgi:photosystem II stability/assembly factor-like uncharacterized protein
MRTMTAFILLFVASTRMFGQSGWFSQTSGTTNSLYDVCFTDASTGTVVGSFGTILRTTNGGATWTAQSSGTPLDLYGVSFSNANTGIVVGSGIALRTTNGGETWSTQSSGILRSVWFTDGINGAAVGQAGTIARTTDGGITWVAQASGTSAHLLDVSFTSSDKGIAVGIHEFELLGVIVRTTDGGETWTLQGNEYPLSGVSMVNTLRATAVGYYGRILLTTDGGITWVAQASGTSADLSDVSFTDSANGIAVGESGEILRTVNGGTTWLAQTSGTTNNLYGVSFTNANTGTAVGANGTILRTTNGGVTFAEEPSLQLLPSEYSLEQNYPNPFNPSTRIPFSVRGSGFVSLKVYDILGREVRALVNENLQTGSYEVTFDATGLASGVYFYRLLAGAFTQTKRMLLLK